VEQQYIQQNWQNLLTQINGLNIELRPFLTILLKMFNKILFYT